MTKIKSLCAFALLLSCTIPLAAQYKPTSFIQDPQTKKYEIPPQDVSFAQINQSWERTLQREVIKANPKKDIVQCLKDCAENLPFQNKKSEHCAACGEEITNPGQHCSATDNTGVCSATPQQPQTQEPETEAYCSKCGKHLTIDERYHGQEHNCRAAENHEHCIYCGQAITETNQTCTSGSTHCTTHCPECGKDLRDPANLDASGTHHCRGKLQITPVEPRN